MRPYSVQKADEALEAQHLAKLCKGALARKRPSPCSYCGVPPRHTRPHPTMINGKPLCGECHHLLTRYDDHDERLARERLEEDGPNDGYVF